SLHARGREAGRREADRLEQLLEVGGLVVLLARQVDLDDLLGDARIERDAAELPDAGTGAQDLERALVERRRRLDGDGFVNNALAGGAVAPPDEGGAGLGLLHDRRR